MREGSRQPCGLRRWPVVCISTLRRCSDRYINENMRAMAMGAVQHDVLNRLNGVSGLLLTERGGAGSDEAK